MTLAVDANIALKWFLEETGSAAARELLASGELLIAPDLIIAEAGNVAWTKVKKREMGLDQALELVRELPRYVMLIPATQLIARAVEMAHTVDATVYDCLYLAAAEHWDASLVTDDRAFIEKLRSSAWGGRIQLLGSSAST